MGRKRTGRKSSSLQIIAQTLRYGQLLRVGIHDPSPVKSGFPLVMRLAPTISDFSKMVDVSRQSYVAKVVGNDSALSLAGVVLHLVDKFVQEPPSSRIYYDNRQWTVYCDAFGAMLDGSESDIEDLNGHGAVGPCLLNNEKDAEAITAD